MNRGCSFGTGLVGVGQANLQALMRGALCRWRCSFVARAWGLRCRTIRLFLEIFYKTYKILKDRWRLKRVVRVVPGSSKRMLATVPSISWGTDRRDLI